MSIGLLGKKIGMTQVFGEDGRFIPVSVVQAGPCLVLTVLAKTVRLGFGEIDESRLKNPQRGVFKKLNLKPCQFVKELPKGSSGEYKTGDLLKVDLFNPGDFVDVTGISIGKGFQGGMKRWNWTCGPRSHGSMSHRRVGSIGSSADPSRVWKGHHLPGHMGNVKVTVQNLKIIKIDVENNLLLIRGALPGHKNNYLVIRLAKKKPRKILEAKEKEDKQK
jgi:large subunit ribosomal protein L3